MGPIEVNFEDFRHFQKRERILSGLLVVVATTAPVAFTYLMQRRVHWLVSFGSACALVAAAIWIHLYREKISKKIKVKYETLEIGRVLSKKSRQRHRYVITNMGYNHYYLKSLENGEQVLIPRRRAREDYDLSV